MYTKPQFDIKKPEIKLSRQEKEMYNNFQILDFWDIKNNKQMTEQANMNFECEKFMEITEQER